MQYILMILAVAGITAADQLSKYWTVQNIALAPGKWEHFPALQAAFDIPDTALTELPRQIDAIPGVFHFTHTLNEGAAFSSFEGAQWLFALVFAVFTVAVVWEMIKKSMPFTRLERWLILCIYAGGLGNMIDRLRFGFVIDMIEVEFLDFAVFNVADSFITCGCILLLVHLIFFNKEFWKDEKKK